ncbi:MAG: cell division protein FtsK [Rhodospirillaceae bacterium]|nr:cell division protein FtsK [Rhodospirillaceae bacterium]
MTNTNRDISFLPQGTTKFFKKRAIEILSVILIFFSLFLFISLISYSSVDPSLNTLTNAEVSNLTGLPGAIVADLTTQVFGISIYLLIPILLTWSWRMITHKGIKNLWLKFLFLIITLVLFSLNHEIVLKNFNQPSFSNLNGLVGFIFYKYSIGQINNLNINIIYSIVIILFVFSVLSLIYTLSLSTKEWKKIGNFFRVFTTKIFRLILWFTRTGEKFALKPNLKKGNIDISTEKKPTEKTSNKIIKKILSAKTFFKKLILKRKDGLKRKIEPTLSKGTIDDESVNEKKGRISPSNQKLKKSKREEIEAQTKLSLDKNILELPPLHLLSLNTNKKRTISEEALEQNARMLESVLSDFGISGEITKVRPGPVVTLYELEPARGIKASRVISLADDIARSMSAISARVAVIPGQNAIGIELPNSNRETVYLRELLSSKEYENSGSKLTLALGKDIGGEPIFADLTRMPHLLVAGTTGSGKSVAVNSMILSILYRLSPEQCKLILIDPKMLELSVYDNIPHLLAPVVTEPGKAVVALKWTVREMEKRYNSMSHLGVRNIAGYNQRLDQAIKNKETLTRTVQTGFDEETGKPIFEEQLLDLKPMPYIVVVVDEMADLMLIAGKDIEASVQRLAQMARAAGIHLIMATQRPSVDVITGTIKANFPTRISFQVTSKIDSRTILGEPGAESLLGSGDMLFMQSGGKLRRVHGPFVSDNEVEKIVDFLRRQQSPMYIEEVTTDVDDTTQNNNYNAISAENNDKDEDLFNKATDLICREGKVSTSFIQRHFQIGYNRAARIVERMEKEGIVSKPNRVGKREILSRIIKDE